MEYFSVKDTTLGLSLISHVGITLFHTHHDTRLTGTSKGKPIEVHHLQKNWLFKRMNKKQEGANSEK